MQGTAHGVGVRRREGLGHQPDAGGPGPRELTTARRPARSATRRGFDGPLVSYEDRGDTLEMAGSADLGGAKAWKLKLTRKLGGRTMFHLRRRADTGLEKR